MRRRRGCNASALRVYDHVIGINTDFLQHRAQQRRFVFTIAEAMSKYLRRRMRLYSADTQRDRHIAHISLQEVSQPSHFSEDSGCGTCQGCYFLFDRGGCVAASLSKSVVPASHLGPVEETV